MHILVVDPNEAFATLLSEELKRQGYDVDVCLNGSDALRVARGRAVDFSILDMALANPDALVLGRQLRTLDAAMRLMIIPLMGETLSSQASELGIQGVLPKPFFLPELPGLIETALAAPLNVSRGDSVARAPHDAAAPQSQPTAVNPPASSENRAIDKADGFSYAAFMANRAEVERLMSNLVQDVGADTVLLTFDGGLLTWVGGLDKSSVESVSRAIIHGWQTSAEVARILGREQVRFEQSLAGDDYMLYALSVESSAIMGVAVRGSAPLGLLRHRARTAAEQIAQLCKS